jgi:hypothetical protein
MAGLGDYARTSEGIVFIFGNENGRFQTVSVDRDQEFEHLECELVPWMPLPGEQVWEANNEDSITGAVMKTNERTSLVKWDGFVEPEVWRNTQLEPVSASIAMETH